MGEVSANVLYVRELEKLEQRIKITLCRMEMIFPPGFFTIMVHLVIHLATEAKKGGPVSYRSMWFTERYLGKLKSTVRNKAHPKGSIAEAYLADECMTFCSRYIVGFQTKHNMSTRDEGNEAGHPSFNGGSTLFPHDGKPLEKPRNYVIRGLTKVQAHRYLLFNCSDVNPYLRVHADEITNRHSVNPNTFEEIQNETFHEWFRSHPPKPRGLYDTGNKEYAEDTEPFHVSHLAKMFKNKRHEKHCVRNDIEGTEVDDDNTNAPRGEE